MEDGEGQDLKERIQEIRLLDGYMARRWQDAQRAPGKLQEDECAGGPAEGQGNEGGSIGAKGKMAKEYFRPSRPVGAQFCPWSKIPPVSPSMKRSKHPPHDRILWTLVSLNEKAEWTVLRKRTKLTAAELDAVLSELAKDGKISIIPRERRDQIKP